MKRLALYFYQQINLYAKERLLMDEQKPVKESYRKCGEMVFVLEGYQSLVNAWENLRLWDERIAGDKAVLQII